MANKKWWVSYAKGEIDKIVLRRLLTVCSFGNSRANFLWTNNFPTQTCVLHYRCRSWKHVTFPWISENPRWFATWLERWGWRGSISQNQKVKRPSQDFPDFRTSQTHIHHFCAVVISRLHVSIDPPSHQFCTVLRLLLWAKSLECQEGLTKGHWLLNPDSQAEIPNALGCPGKGQPKHYWGDPQLHGSATGWVLDSRMLELLLASSVWSWGLLTSWYGFTKIHLGSS